MNWYVERTRTGTRTRTRTAGDHAGSPLPNRGRFFVKVRLSAEDGDGKKSDIEKRHKLLK